MYELTIGDRVTIVRLGSTNYGKMGTVYNYLPSRPAPYHVRPDGWPEHQAGIAYTREELELIRTKGVTNVDR